MFLVTSEEPVIIVIPVSLSTAAVGGTLEISEEPRDSPSLVLLSKANADIAVPPGDSLVSFDDPVVLGVEVRIDAFTGADPDTVSSPSATAVA